VAINSPADLLFNSSTLAGVTGELLFSNPNSTTKSKKLTGQVTAQVGSGTFEGISTLGFYGGTSAVTQFQFLMSSGNIASGTITVYGLAQ
jgi:hypothetical protein